MAKKKASPPPLLAVKFDFVESLDALIQKGVTLHSAITFVIEHGNLAEPIRDRLKKAVDEWHDAMFTKD